MSKSIFVSLDNIDLMAASAAQSSSPSLPETPLQVIGQKRFIPYNFEVENSQQSRSFSFPTASQMQTPLPSISSMNVASVIRQYLSQKNVSVAYVEEVLKYICEPSQVRDAMMFAELVMARSREQASIQSQVWIPRNDKKLFNKLKCYSMAINQTSTIKSYSTYTGPLLLFLFLHLKWEVPSDLKDDPTKKAALESEIKKYHLTQSRNIAKLQKSTCEESPQNIYEAALSLIEGTDMQIMLPFIYRVAFLRAELTQMTVQGANLETFWTQVNKRLAKVNEQGDTNPAYVRILLEKVIENDQELYRAPPNINKFGQVLLANNITAVSNLEKNVAVAISGALMKKKARPDPNIDPALHGPLGNPPNSITMSGAGQNSSETNDLDDCNDMYDDTGYEPNLGAAEEEAE